MLSKEKWEKQPLMEIYKEKEIKHYDNLAGEWQENSRKDKWNGDAEYLVHGTLSSYHFVDNWFRSHIKKGDSLLDYGCGNGIHSILPAKLGATVMGIDLSKKSLAIAKERAKRENIERKVTFKQMDCEALRIDSRTFDCVFDGGTFSSLDITKAVPEIARVLKPRGTLVAIETLGHNPFANAKRKMNAFRGIRTSWALDHIFKMDDLLLLKKYFGHLEYHVFHLVSLISFPFLQFWWGKKLLSALNHVDMALFRLPFLRRFAFKIVIIATNPKSHL
jgi:SAM-dependent methyltransferase